MLQKSLTTDLLWPALVCSAARRPARGSYLAKKDWTTQVTSLYTYVGGMSVSGTIESIWERLPVTNTLTDHIKGFFSISVE